MLQLVGIPRRTKTLRQKLDLSSGTLHLAQLNRWIDPIASMSRVVYEGLQDLMLVRMVNDAFHEKVVQTRKIPAYVFVVGIAALVIVGTGIILIKASGDILHRKQSEMTRFDEGSPGGDNFVVAYSP